MEISALHSGPPLGLETRSQAFHGFRIIDADKQP